MNRAGPQVEQRLNAYWHETDSAGQARDEAPFPRESRAAGGEEGRAPATAAGGTSAKRVASPSSIPAPAGARAQAEIDRLTELGRERALTPAESLLLERCIYDVDGRRRPYRLNRDLARFGVGRGSYRIPEGA